MVLNLALVEPSDLVELTDQELTDLYVHLVAEQGRRARLASIPEQIAELADSYEVDGGVRSDLLESITSEVA